MVDFAIENVIVTTDIEADLNLNDIASVIPEVDYDRKSFPGIVIKLDNPKTVTFILKSGKTVCTGGKSFKESRIALEAITQKLKDSGVKIKDDLYIDVKNIIVSLNLQTKLNLEEVGTVFNWQKMKYEPDQFPGLIYETDIDNVSILVFDSGKIVCSGAKKLSEINRVLDKFINRMHAVGLI